MQISDDERVYLCVHAARRERPIGVIQFDEDGSLQIRCRNHEVFTADQLVWGHYLHVRTEFPEIVELIADLEPGERAVFSATKNDWIIIVPE